MLKYITQNNVQMCISNILPQRKWDQLQILSQFLGLRTCQLIWLLTLEPSDLKHFNPQNTEMFSLHTIVRSVFVILVLNGWVSFKSSTVHAIPRIHTLLWEKSHRCRVFFLLTPDKVTSECLYSMSHESAFLTSVTFYPHSSDVI